MIDWVEEVEIIYKCLRLVAKPHEPSMSLSVLTASVLITFQSMIAWIDYHQIVVEYFTVIHLLYLDSCADCDRFRTVIALI